MIRKYRINLLIQNFSNENNKINHLTANSIVILLCHAYSVLLNLFVYRKRHDVLKIYRIYQVREDWNAGGSMLFSWKDNGIPEKFVDIVNSSGKKVWNSDFIHIKKGNKFKFNRSFTISRITIDKGIKYYQMDSGLGNKYRFWVVGNFLSKV